MLKSMEFEDSTYLNKRECQKESARKRVQQIVQVKNQGNTAEVVTNMCGAEF